MFDKLRPRLSPALVLSFVALLAAVSGGAFAAATAKRNSVTTKSIKNNAVTAKKVKDDTLTGADIAESTLGQVPDSAALGGVPAGSYALRELGTFVSLTSSLQNGWIRNSQQLSEPGYWVSDDGLVHLQGVIKSGALNANIFALPANLVPKTSRVFTVLCGAGLGELSVFSNGNIQLTSLGGNCAGLASLDGVTWRPDI